MDPRRGAKRGVGQPGWAVGANVNGSRTAAPLKSGWQHVGNSGAPGPYDVRRPWHAREADDDGMFARIAGLESLRGRAGESDAGALMVMSGVLVRMCGRPVLMVGMLVFRKRVHVEPRCRSGDRQEKSHEERRQGLDHSDQSMDCLIDRQTRPLLEEGNARRFALKPVFRSNASPNVTRP